MMKCRVFFKKDGTVSVTHFVWKCRREKETELEFMNRVTQKLDIRNLPYEDMDPKKLPVRFKNGINVRNKWRGRRGEGVWIDETMKTLEERRIEIDAKIDGELSKASPDSVAVVRLQREKEKLMSSSETRAPEPAGV